MQPGNICLSQDVYVAFAAFGSQDLNITGRHSQGHIPLKAEDTIIRTSIQCKISKGRKIRSNFADKKICCVYSF